MKIVWALKATWSGEPRPDRPKELWWCRPRVWTQGVGRELVRLLYDGEPLAFLRAGVEVETRLDPNYVVRLVRIKRYPKPLVMDRLVVDGKAILVGTAPVISRGGPDFNGYSFLDWLRCRTGHRVRVTLERLAPHGDEQNPPGFGADPPEVP